MNRKQFRLGSRGKIVAIQNFGNSTKRLSYRSRARKDEKPDYTQRAKKSSRTYNRLLLPRYNKKDDDLIKQSLTAQLTALKKKLQALETK